MVTVTSSVWWRKLQGAVMIWYIAILQVMQAVPVITVAQVNMQAYLYHNIEPSLFMSHLIPCDVNSQ